MIYIVIPTFNRVSILLNCLDSLKKQAIREKAVVVVDDGSSDGTAEQVKRLFPQVTVLGGDGNLWWTGATNAGVQWVLATAKSDDKVLTLNDDTIVPEDYLGRLLETAEKYPNALIGSVAVSDQDRTTIVDAGVQINWLTAKFHCRHIGEKSRDVIDRPRWRKLDVLPGRGTLIPIEVFHRVGLYAHAALPQYGADYEFSNRAKRAGYDLIIDMMAIVYSHVALTGINHNLRNLTWKEAWRSLFSIRSPNCLRYRFNFARLSCPKSLLCSFILFDTVRVLFSLLRKQIRWVGRVA